MDNNVLIFDFDGTIADTFYALFDIINKLAQEFDFKPVDADEIELFREKSSREILCQLEIPLYQLPSIIRKAKQALNRIMPDITLSSDLRKTLIDLKNTHTVMGIVTSNSLENVHSFLNKNDIDIFDFVCSSSGLWGKKRRLNNVVKKYGFNRENVYYIGDETRDIDISRHAGVKAVSVTWGYNSASILRQHKPDYVIEKPDKLLTFHLDSPLKL